MARSFIVCVIPLLALCGCSGLMTLKRYSDGQRMIAGTVARNDALFESLLRDARAGKVCLGITRENVISKYGEPVLSLAGDQAGLIAEKMLYRKSCEYVNTDKVYLYFDRQGRLSRIEICLANEARREV